MRSLLLAALAAFLVAPLGAATPSSGAAAALVSARQQFQAGHFADAAAALQSAIRVDSASADLYFWLGRSYYELGNYDQAAQQMEKAVHLDGQNSDFHLWLARTYGRLADSHHSFWMGIRARKQFQKAVELGPQNIPARRDLAEFYTEAPWIVGGSKDDARAQIAAITHLDPIQGALAQAEFDRQTGNLTAAEAEYQQVLSERPTTLLEYYELADHFAARNDADSLRRAVDGAVQIAPGDPRLVYYRAVILAIDGVHLSQAENDLKEYLAGNVDRTGYPLHSDALTWLGNVYEKMGRRLDAAEQYRAALAINPDSSFAKKSLKRLEGQGGN